MLDIAETIKIAVQHHQANRLEQAEQLCQLVLRSQSDNASALHILGLIAHQRGSNHLAVDLISKAVASNSQVPQFHNNLGVALKALGKFEEAVQAYEKALLLKPDYADACYNIANSLESLGRHTAAVQQYKQALLLKPDDAHTYYNMGIAMQMLGHHAEAIENFNRAIQINPDSAGAYRAMAVSQQIQGRYPEAISSLNRALHLEPDCARTHTDLGMVLLRTGNFTEGWPEYRWRLENSFWMKHYNDASRWNGSNFAGKRLLVRCEQGLGDNIQFVRYLPMVKSRGGTVVFGAFKQLYSLLKDSPGIDEIVNISVRTQPLVFDLYSPIMDLPGIFGTMLETIPAQVPYIHADHRKAAYWRQKLPGTDFKVGIVWSGSPAYKSKHLRDCKLADFAPLSEIDGVKLYALQKGGAAQQIEQFAGKIPVVNLGEQFDDFSDTAAAIENLDLVISVDTSVAHLAGAMGKPVWLILTCTPAWQWLLDRDDNPWYPTMRLFRQQKLGQWNDVFHRVAGQLRILLARQDVLV